MSLNLDKLIKQRDNVLLSEIGALVHDLGKLSQEFIEAKAAETQRLDDVHWLFLRRAQPFLPTHLIPYIGARTQMDALLLHLHSLSTDQAKELTEFMQAAYDQRHDIMPEQAIAQARRSLSSLLSLIEQTEQWLRQYQEGVGNLERDWDLAKLYAQVPLDFIPDALSTLLCSITLPEQHRDSEALVAETTLGDLIERHHSPPPPLPSPSYVDLLRTPGSDGVDSGVDKGVEERFKEIAKKEKQPAGNTFIATAFGYEEGRRIDIGSLKAIRHAYAEALANTLTRIQTARSRLMLGQQLDPSLWKEWLYGDQGLRLRTRQTFLNALGETRRAANDVTLWDHSFSVATLYKAALARVILTGEPIKPQEIQWRLLYVTFNGLGFISKAHHIGDVLGRQEVLKQAMDTVRDLIEVEVPLGNEVYRDENGTAFVLPELPDEVDQQALTEFLCTGGKVNVDNQERDIAGIETRFLEKTEGELVPSCRFWENVVPSELTRDVDKVRKWKLQQLGELIRQAPPWPCITTEAVGKVEDAWRNPPADAELCPICRLRPKTDPARACRTCEKRSRGRAWKWQSEPWTTIWIDEVADVNGRAALVAGSFDLADWLNGDLVRTLFTVADGDTQQFEPKHPSPARLRRVWTTTRDFWQSLADAEIAEDRRTGRRWAFKVRGLRLEPGKYLQWGNYDAHLLDRPTFKFSLFCDDNGRLLLIENPVYLAGQLGCAPEEVPRELARHEIQLFEASERLERGDKVATLWLVPDKAEPTHYAPLIPILITPRRFLTIVPAREAFALLERIRDKYEAEMGRVRDRLPVTLGVVFFDRHTPLVVVIEAGRRMLTMSTKPEVWRIVHAHAHDWYGRLTDVRRLTDVQDKTVVQGEPVQVCLQLQSDDNEVIDVCLGTARGDGKPDFFYPYWRLAADHLPAGRTYIVPQREGQPWPLVHAADLREGDKVHFTPSRFDFEYLDVAGRRYEVAYKDNGRRRGRPSRPYLLEDLRCFKQVWDLLAGARMLSTAQIEALSAAIETRREEGWQTADPVSFEQFVRDTLANAGDGWWRKLAPGEQRLLENWAIRGRLADVVEWFMSLMKEKPARDRQTMRDLSESR